MKPVVSGHGRKARIPALVWTLSAVAMGTGVLAMVMAYLTLTQIRERRVHVKMVEARAATSLRALRRERETVFLDLEAHFREDPNEDRPVRRAPDSLDRYAAECKDRLAQLETDGVRIHDTAMAMEQVVASLAVIHGETETYAGERARVRGLLHTAWRNVQKELVKTRAATEKMEGRQRLRHGVLLRRYRDAAEEEVGDLALQYIDELESVRYLRTLASELSELALLAEQLHGEDQIDQLVSLKDNEIRQVLMRLHWAAEKAIGAGGVALISHIEALQEAIFGIGAVDDVDHQTLVIGQGGLFGLRLEALTLEIDGRRLQRSVSGMLNLCLEAERGFDHVLSSATDADAIRAESVLRTAWRHTLITAIAAAVVFLVLSWRIANLGRLAEAQLRLKNESLEAAMGQLRAATLDAEAANRSKSEFLANMSHEIRTPMTAILGFAENMLEADQSDSEKLNCVHIIRRNGEYLIDIINDILDLSKIEAGKVSIECRDCQPCQVIAEVTSLMRVRADAKGLPFDVEYIGAIPETIQCDATRLRQILINMVGNAIKFTETGAVRLTARFVDSGGAPFLQFDVTDTGRGMTKEQVDRLFQPFMQADSSTTRKFGGTGLGLTISKRFAELLGGNIIVAASDIGVGTTFRVTVATGPVEGVRMLENPLSATVVADSPTAVIQVARSGLHGLRILLAEDGPDNQRLISFMLKKSGADVTVKETGKLALDAALTAHDAGNPFDCILMDMQMPVMDGYEATARLRRKGHAGLIVALTAHAMEGDREKCMKAGCDDYVIKPIDRKKLIHLISRHVQDRQSKRETLQTETSPRSSLQGCRILLAEDNPTNQVLVTGILEKSGAEVTVAKDGKLALDTALAARDQGNPFDVILMDMQMPVMDGYDATGQLRKEGYAWPIIALTAHMTDGDRDKCIDAGCDECASKPINRKMLIEMIQRYMLPAEAASPTAR